jgi:hypothetical protein
MADLRQAAGRLRTQLRPSDRPRTAPEENGERLATIPRSEGEELRLNWSEYNGHHFLNIRLWAQGDDGTWWPQKDKGLTVRVRELPDFAEGVAAALARLVNVVHDELVLEVTWETAAAGSTQKASSMKPKPGAGASQPDKRNRHDRLRQDDAAPGDHPRRAGLHRLRF